MPIIIRLLKGNQNKPVSGDKSRVALNAIMSESSTIGFQ